MTAKLLIPKQVLTQYTSFVSFHAILAVFLLRESQPPKCFPVPTLTVYYFHLLRDFVCARSGKAVSSCQHPVLAHNGSKTRHRLEGREALMCEKATLKYQTDVWVGGMSPWWSRLLSPMPQRRARVWCRLLWARPDLPELPHTSSHSCHLSYDTWTFFNQYTSGSHWKTCYSEGS